MQRFGFVLVDAGVVQLDRSNFVQWLSKSGSGMTWSSGVSELQSQSQIRKHTRTVPHTTLAPLAESFRLSVRWTANLLDKRPVSVWCTHWFFFAEEPTSQIFHTLHVKLLSDDQCTGYAFVMSRVVDPPTSLHAQQVDRCMSLFFL